MLMRSLFGACCAAAFLLAAGCGTNNNGCLPAVAANSTECPTAVFVDASTTDPICLNASGSPECRADDAVCYQCTGASFTDGCVVKNAEQTIECVHTCDKC